MIIEIMLIILAMISVVVNTIVSVIIIKDTLNNRKWQDRIDKETEKDKVKIEQLKQSLNSLYGKRTNAEACKQAKQELEKDLQMQPITTINPNNPQPNDKLHYAYAIGQKDNTQNNDISNTTA